MISICICDDDVNDTKHYIELMQSITKNISITNFSSGKSLLFNCDKNNINQFDIIFMDVEMEEINGIETMKIMRKLGYSGELIYLTTIQDYVFDSFDTAPLNYLLKFDSPDKFKTVFETALASIYKKNISIFTFNSKTIQYNIKISEIVYLESKGRKLFLHMQDSQVYNCYMKLPNALKQLQNNHFIRIHNSFAINSFYIIGVKNNVVYLQDNIELPISRTFAKNVKSSINEIFKHL